MKYSKPAIDYRNLSLYRAKSRPILVHSKQHDDKRVTTPKPGTTLVWNTGSRNFRS